MINHYVCTGCGLSWSDHWDCACDDRCPECSRSMTPLASTDTEAEGNALISQPFGLASRSLLEVSTAHITRGDNALLSEDSLQSGGPLTRPLSVSRATRGFFIVIPDDGSMREAIGDCERRGYSESLRRLLGLCSLAGAAVLRLDGDVPHSAALPVHAW